MMINRKLAGFWLAALAAFFIVSAPARAVNEFCDLAQQEATWNGSAFVLGAAVDGFTTFEGAGCSSGSTVSFGVWNKSSGARETATGTLDLSGTPDTLTRTTVVSSEGGVGVSIAIAASDDIEVGTAILSTDIDAIYSDTQPLDGGLTDIAGLTPTDSNIIVGNGTNWVAESGATARTSLGLGTGDSPQFTALEVGHASANTISCSSGHCLIEAATIWDSGNDGAASGLDADLLDGVTSADFLTEAEAALAYQPLDADLTSWAAVARAVGFDTFTATPSMVNLGSLLTDDAAGWITFGTTPSSANFATLVTDDAFSLADIEIGAIAGLTSAANQIPYFTGSGTAGLISFTPSDGNLDELLGWDDSDSQYESMSLAEIATEGSPATDDFVLIYGAEGDLRKVNWSGLPGASSTFPSGLLYGLTLSNNGTDAVNDIDVAVGSAANSTNAVVMQLEAAITKRLDAAWTVATNQGCLDGTESSGGTPDTSTWYHIYLIRRSDTGVEDIACSENATTPSIDATPIPVAYDQYRRLGSVFNNSSGDIAAFRQYGDTFKWVSAVLDRADSADVAWALTTISIPLGVTVAPIVQCIVAATTGTTLIRLGDFTDSGKTAPFRPCTAETGGASVGVVTGGFFSNTSSQIYYEFDETTTGTNSLVTVGWIDQRGRLN
jgi:hypothetical protein